jgi:DNA polymerase I-like protein with 3'-5' exonuclease and polymerase domains
MDIITSTDALAAACDRLSTSEFVTIDTEFLRETTFWPQLCLIQMASPDLAVIVDPLANGIDLSPFFKLMADTKITKVFHAARQDIEIIFHLGDLIPHPIFDTQIAAMVCGFGDSISYDQLGASTRRRASPTGAADHYRTRNSNMRWPTSRICGTSICTSRPSWSEKAAHTGSRKRWTFWNRARPTIFIPTTPGSGCACG